MGGKDLEDRIAQLEAQVEEIRERNARVAHEKAWEISLYRRITVAGITYIIACMLLWSIRNEGFLLNSMVPTVGYLLSTLTLPWAKSRWIRRQ